MADLFGIFATLGDLALVVFGFGLIIFLHELGHFLAARWAGIRVLAFAIGFGPAMISYRKGMGWRRGSSEREYLHRIARSPRSEDAQTLSPTEYRINWLPLGGYVKMLGQEDFNPNAVSAEPDSYQACPPWKRLVVISAGVVANVITAAILFIFVFMVGIRSEPAKVGTVYASSPAALAMPANADHLGIRDPGLMPGDRVLSINGEAPRHFNDLNLAIVMSERNQPVDLLIERAGYDEPLEFSITPQPSEMTGLLEIGIGPAHTAFVVEPPRSWQRRELAAGLDAIGLEGVEPGMELVAAGVQPVRTADDLTRIVRDSGGRPLTLRFEHPADSASAEPRRATPVIEPVPEFEFAWVLMPSGRHLPVEHVAGLVGVMTVEQTGEKAERAGLRAGDVFLRIGGTEFPSLASGIAEIKAAAGSVIPITVRREVDGETRTIDLEAPVGRDGTIGFAPGAGFEGTLLARPLQDARLSPRDEEPTPLPAAGVFDRPGLELITLEGAPVASLVEARTELQKLARDALAAERNTLTVTLGLGDPLAEPAGGDPASAPIETATLTLGGESLRSVAALAWDLPFSMSIFELEQFKLRAGDPLHAIGLGLAETNRVMVTTYLTFARLFQGTVKIEHLKGPVGIAHLGTRIAERGLIWLLFFLALISVNLAVINFLPLPIVDGGQFLMILYEMIRGRPVPLGFQSAITLVGLVLIGAMFIIVTYHDIVGLFGG